MLTPDDLKQIGEIVDQKLDQKFDEKLEPVLKAVRVGFEAVDRRFETTEAKMAIELNDLRHELMDHTDRTVHKAIGDLRAELRERDLIA